MPRLSGGLQARPIGRVQARQSGGLQARPIGRVEARPIGGFQVLGIARAEVRPIGNFEAQADRSRCYSTAPGAICSRYHSVMARGISSIGL